MRATQLAMPAVLLRLLTLMAIPVQEACGATDASACIASASELEAAGVSSFEDAAEEVDASADEEAELVDVRLLQTSMQLAGHVREKTTDISSVVEADGDTQLRDDGAGAQAQDSSRRAANAPDYSSNSFQGTVAPGDYVMWAPAVTGNSTSFASQAMPLVAPRGLLLQMATIQELSQSDSSIEVERLPTTPMSSFFAWDTGKLRAQGILLTYFLIYTFSISTMFYHMNYAQRQPQQPKIALSNSGRKLPSDTSIEDDTLMRAPLSWLCVSWLNPLMARLGSSTNSAIMKCTPEELPQIGTAKDQAILQVEQFEKLWQEEKDRVGEEKASFLRVIIKMWTMKSVVWICFLMAIHVVAGNLYQVTLIQRSLEYFYWLQGTVNMNNGELPEMSNSILISMICFTIMPFLDCVLCSLELRTLNVCDQQLCSVAVSLFRKTQRLPASSLSAGDGSGGEEKPNVMMTINNDLAGNFHGLIFCIASTMNAGITILLLVVLMAVKLRLATLCTLFVAIPSLLFSIVMSAAMGVSMMSLQGLTDKRVTAVREVLQGIRVVKSYAWEAAMESEIGNYRKKEMESLKAYYRLIGQFISLFTVFPRLLTLAGLWGYTYLYGSQDLATIFACLQILASLRNQCELLSSNVQALVNVGASSARIEKYLKLEEAPVLPGIRVPSWVQMWPKDSQAGVDCPASSFRLQGSFAWTSKNPERNIVLHDLNVQLQAGQMLAIVGAVGSGKSTFLEAALGELYPASQEASLSRPHICAYCPQVPHIAEGTLRDNILFGQAFDEQRYREVIAAASLENDLKVLPGGDEAFIGARGISLSGGQRARVALARAAYRSNAELLLIDDPFAAVDAPTGAALLQKLLLGPLLKSRTRLVVLQPEMERIAKFDHVIVLSEGRIVASGKPEEIVETDIFKTLQRVSQSELSEDAQEQDASPKRQGHVGSKELAEDSYGVQILRDTEGEGRPTWEMVRRYIGIGKWRNILSAFVLWSLCLFLYLLCDISLGNCTNALSIDRSIPTGPFFRGYLFWLLCGATVQMMGWSFGETFSLRISDRLHGSIIHRLLRAPIDRFFDRQPLGRIMNRMTSDMAAIDFHLFLKIAGTVMIIFQTAIPLMYIHTIMPWLVTVLALPFYYVIGILYMRYQNAIVPLRYCQLGVSSCIVSRLSDVMANSVVTRGFGEEARLTSDYAAGTDDAIKAVITETRLVKRWLMNRVNFLWTFYNVTIYVVGLYNSATLGAGTLGIVLTNLLLLQLMLEPNLDFMAGSMFELIALARVHEYSEVAQERAMRTTEDSELRNYTVTYLRGKQPVLSFREGQDGGVEVSNPNGVLLLRSTRDGRALALAEADSYGRLPLFQDLCPSCEVLGQVGRTHLVYAANDAVGDAKAIAQELCKPLKSFITACSYSTPPKVVLDLKSGWLAEGARVDVQNLSAGYGDIPQNVLKGVSFCVEPQMKAAIVGTTGCGKSSVLLALLRIIEPRGGRVVINSIDTRDIGLATLRSALGLVPQDPILFSGTIRHNLDPFKQYTDGRMKRAVKCAHLEAFINSLPLGLDHMVADEGNNLSFGQRQLLCLARMVLRQPALLLLDEATSAIDPRTQESVQDTINSAFPASTMLAVAHRLETIMQFDQVIVLDKGAVVESGPVKEIAVRSGGTFKGMLDAKKQW
eukprot:TRINITY_DN103641_c0_g1_i1.p1 TRINITY_DN103641_c0_g1~~TRINITY_DN103641_c0_g1_i1.p1  ORF type:complete len:1660 (-),score=304.97 TRINITY_DN103641_c0_g1_i1:123-5102(-)